MISSLQTQLEKRALAGNIRNLPSCHTENLIDLSSNDYLGLAKSSKLSSMLLNEWISFETIERHQLGSTGSRLLTGNSCYAEKLENTIATFHGFEAGLLFNCGYMANMGLLSTIAGPRDIIIFDEQVHASTREGIRISKAKSYPFRHNDLDHLEKRLTSVERGGELYLCIESIYSTDGTKAPLAEICALAESYQVHLIVDEAHSTGLCGPEGRGLVADLNITGSVYAQIITFGKALGVSGAIVLGNKTLIKALVNFSRPFIYTTALPFWTLAAIQSSYQLFPGMEEERNHLQHLVKEYGRLFSVSSNSHIHAISTPGNENATSAEAYLNLKGLNVRALKSPTVRHGKESLRISLHSFNTIEDITRLHHAFTHYQGIAHD